MLPFLRKFSYSNAIGLEAEAIALRLEAIATRLKANPFIRPFFLFLF